MKIKDFIKEDYEEYNDEASMVKSNLATIIRSAEELEQLIHLLRTVEELVRL